MIVKARRRSQEALRRIPTIDINNQSIFENLMQVGLRHTLVEASWSKLALVVFSFYAVMGCLAGSVAYLCSLSRESNIDATDTSEDIQPSDLLLWWERGFWTLLVEKTWDPESVAEYAVSMCIPVSGAVISLLLFGIVY